MTRAVYITPQKEREDTDNKFICIILGCQADATEQLDLPFGKYGSTLFFQCKNCLDKIQRMRST
ncbi:MAG: hypothetical protein L0H53_08380 [Candidatus Nitrosocosmicus sp.]|nr:hypothetical protein [Candidatus Nitrosocosmicus sp.]MDN5866105.1 hypothetical protein [Candidatus Nitrosocosmicus sp.]